MRAATRNAATLTKQQARRAWLHAQRLGTRAPFGESADATLRAVEHLGYVQIDTINVIERAHHHILFARIPSYRREHLHQAQTVDKTVFEYWAHALAYMPTRDIRHSVRLMHYHRRRETTVKPAELRKVLSLIKRQGPLTIRDIEDDVLVEKDHAWASRKPSAKALRLAFYRGQVAISERVGILKTYELTARHFGWTKPPRPAPERETLNYLLDRALRAQGIVSLASACYMDAPRKSAMQSLIEGRVRRKELVRVDVEEAGKTEHWASPETLAMPALPDQGLVHILSPFDPLIIQRKRLKFFFGYDHIFEAYVPKPKRKFGYFALPVLVGDEVVAAIDLKTDREKGKLLVQKWTWLGPRANRGYKAAIEDELARFERFQLGL
jgi:uncharacterized protein YcaQ